MNMLFPLERSMKLGVGRNAHLGGTHNRAFPGNTRTQWDAHGRTFPGAPEMLPAAFAARGCLLKVKDVQTNYFLLSSKSGNFFWNHGI